jgi:prophage regulatory protein
MIILRFWDLRRKGISFSRPHIKRLEAAGQFPKRIRLSCNSIGWVESEVEAFLKAKADLRPHR